jgi:hypothetical protein
VREALLIVGGWSVPRSPTSVVAVVKFSPPLGVLEIDDLAVTLAPRIPYPSGPIPGPRGPVNVPVVIRIEAIRIVEATGRIHGTATFRCDPATAVDGASFTCRPAMFLPLLERLRELGVPLVCKGRWA